jgi:hypothetical protein
LQAVVRKVTGSTGQWANQVDIGGPGLLLVGHITDQRGQIKHSSMDPCTVVGFNYDPSSTPPLFFAPESHYLEIPYAKCVSADEDAAQSGFNKLVFFDP